jgi:hypothetical protein
MDKKIRWRRLPAVAGYFYEADPERLRARMASIIPQAPRAHAIAIIVPHAGYQYSGATAGKAYARVIIPDHLILVGPNHRGRGPRICVYPGGLWETPLGAVPVDAALTDAILEEIPGAVADATPHNEEHSLEVQANFIAYLQPTASSCFIIVSDLALEEAQAVGEALARVLEKKRTRALMIASTDLSHYFPEEEARRRDARAIDAMLALDESALFDRVEKEDINMCGYIAAAIVIRAAKARGATMASLVDYRTSAQASGDPSAVVGYAGIVLQ